MRQCLMRPALTASRSWAIRRVTSTLDVTGTRSVVAYDRCRLALDLRVNDFSSDDAEVTNLHVGGGALLCLRLLHALVAGRWLG